MAVRDADGSYVGTMEAVQEEYSNTVLALIDSSGNYYLTKDNKRIDAYLKGLEDNLTYDMMPRASLMAWPGIPSLSPIMMAFLSFKIAMYISPFLEFFCASSP